VRCAGEATITEEADAARPTRSGIAVTSEGIVNLLSDLSNARLVCHTRLMSTPPTDRYKHHRFPAGIISHGVWLYFRFCLSYRDVEELLFARGVIVTYEAIRNWCLKFGQAYANQLRRRCPQTWRQMASG